MFDRAKVGACGLVISLMATGLASCGFECHYADRRGEYRASFKAVSSCGQLVSRVVELPSYSPCDLLKENVAEDECTTAQIVVCQIDTRSSVKFEGKIVQENADGSTLFGDGVKATFSDDTGETCVGSYDITLERTED